MADNAQIIVRNEGDTALRLALSIAMLGYKQATHYIDHPEHGLILFWHKENDTLPLPYPMSGDSLYALVRGWLHSQPDERYKNYEYDDVGKGKGFELYNDEWGHVAGSFYAICGIRPFWMWYGK